MAILRLLTTAMIFFTFSSMAYAGEDFPGRSNKKYKDVPYIEIKDLRNKFNDTIVVDARSKFEYDTLRIKGSVNIPVAFDTFEKKVLELRKKT